MKERLFLLLKILDDKELISDAESLINDCAIFEKMLLEKNENTIEMLNNIYLKYKQLNRISIIKGISEDKFKLVHFLANNTNTFDSKKNTELKWAAKEKVKQISNEKERNILYNQIEESLQHPEDLFIRVPMKSVVTSSRLRKIITPENLNLSCSIISQRNINTHLNRNVGIGFIKLPVDNISMITKNYNNFIIDYSFENHEYNLGNIMEKDGSISMNEVIINTQNVKADYVVLLSEYGSIKPADRIQAEKISNRLNIPIVILEKTKSYENIK